MNQDLHQMGLVKHREMTQMPDWEEVKLTPS